MEITLDVGKNIIHDIGKLAEKEKSEFDIVALKILDLGLRVYQADKNNSDEVVVDPMLSDIFRNTLESNFLLKEIIGHVFVRDKSTIKAYNHLSAISVSENMAKAFIKGKNMI